MKTHEIISFHPGRQHNLEQAYQIHKVFKNFKHLTSLYFDSKTVKQWESIFPKIGLNLKKRSAALPGSVVDTNPLPEVKMLIKRKLGYKASSHDYLERNLIFQKWVIKNYSPPKICIGYDTSSWEVFQKWKNKSFLILDLSIAVPQYKLILAKKYNAADAFIHNQTKDDAPTYDIYTKELALADLILCGSEFVKASCIAVGVDPDKLIVLPYGTDLEKFNTTASPKNIHKRIKIAFIGNVNYRKGADFLLQAWEQVSKSNPDVELHFYGNVQIAIPENLERVFFHGFINQSDLILELRDAQISILPSFFEGSSLAIYQSMALGLAVITTPNTGSIIENKKTGLLINYGAVDEIIASLQLLIENKTLREELAAAAQATIQKYAWDDYGRKLNTLLKEELDNTKTTKYAISRS